MASSSSSTPQYTVFISHAGPDKHTIAIPLRAKLQSHNVSAFVDEADMEPGTEAIPAMIHAMESAEVAVVVMSPEFVARKWPMKELMCFLRRREQTRDNSRRVPVIIPFFYRLSISELYDEPRLDRIDAKGDSIYDKSRFLVRMANKEPEAQVGEIKAALDKLHEIMGVRNDDGISNKDTYQMERKRDKLLDLLCEKVLNAVLPKKQEMAAEELPNEEENGETFRPHFDRVSLISKYVFTFFGMEANIYADTREGKVLEKLLDETTYTSRVIAIRGIGGVGKTSMLRALCCLNEVKERFRDGVYCISMGVECTCRKLIEELSEAVEKSGGRGMANKIRAEKDFVNVTKLFRSWFSGKQCMFTVDDVWKTGEITSIIISQLFELHESGKESRVLLTTRSLEIASTADICIGMEPCEALGADSRAILMRYAGIKPPGDGSKDSKIVEEILVRCGGLPLFLAAAGKSVKALSFRRGHQGSAAYHAYAQSLAVNTESLLDMDVNDYQRLSVRLKTSIDVVEERRSALRIPTQLGIGLMHRRLAATDKQSQIPMMALRWLWELYDERQAAVIAKEFEQVGLAEVEFEKRGSGYVELLRLHDSIHDFAVAETEKYGENKLGHEKLLEGYGTGLAWREHCREWWSTHLRSDGYIHDELCRHLAGAGRYRELIELLLRPEWASRAVMVSGVFSLQDDVRLGIRVLEHLREEGIIIFSDSWPSFQSPFERHFQSQEALELVLEALTLSCGYLVVNPGETSFQLHGRLIGISQSLGSFKPYPSVLFTLVECLIEQRPLWWQGFWKSVNVTEAYVKQMEEGCLKRGVRSLNSFLDPAGPVVARLFKHHCSILSMELLKDGKRGIYGSCDGSLVIVNLIRSEVENEWYAHRDGVESLAIAKDGNHVLSGSLDGTATVWNLDYSGCWIARTHLATFKGHAGPVSCVAFLPDGNRAVSASHDGTIQMWDIYTGRLVLPTFTGHTAPVQCLAVFPDGDRMVTAGYDRTLRLWNVKNGAEIDRAVVDHKSLVLSIAVTVDGRRIVSGSLDGTIRLWSAEALVQIRKPLQRNTSYIYSVHISRDGKRILSGSQDNTVCVWDVVNKKKMSGPPIVHSAAVRGVAFLPNEDSISSCCADGTIRVWNLHPKTGEKSKDGYEIAIRTVSFKPDGTKAVSQFENQTIRIWDPRSGLLLDQLLSSEPSRVPGKSLEIYEYFTVNKRMWNLEVLKDLRSFWESTDSDRTSGGSVAFNSGGLQAVGGFRDGSVRMLDLTNPDHNPFTLGQHVDPVCSTFVSEDGRRVISVDRKDNIFVWDLRTRKRLREFRINESSKQTRKWIMNAIGEETSDDTNLLIPTKGQKISHWDGNKRTVLATMESRITDWALSQDKRTICLGLQHGRVAFLKLGSLMAPYGSLSERPIHVQ